MTLNQFALFAAVAKHLNVRKAAEALRVSQPLISQQLRQLENHFGAKLYRRRSRGVEITEQGQLFLRSITPLLEEVAKLERGFKNRPATSAPEVLRVGGTFSASALLLPKLLARFRQRHPMTDLELQTSSSAMLERMVAKASIQIAVTDREPSGHDLAWERLRGEKVLVFVLPGHPLARRQSIELSDLLAEPLIIRGGKGVSGTTEKVLNELRDKGWGVRISMRCDGPAAIKAAVRQRMGVGFAFADSVKFEISSGEFKALRVDGLKLKADSFILHAKSRPLSRLAEEFLGLLRAEQKD